MIVKNVRSVMGLAMKEFKKLKCLKKIIPVIGGAKLQINGDFKLSCIGITCEKYPCKELENGF